MKFLTKNDYTAPEVEVVYVTCETGFLGSTEDLTFDDGEDGGWSKLY